MSLSFRHTKVTFTLGPATESTAVLRELIDEGVDVCRLNMAHASHDWTRMVIRRIKATCHEAGRQIAIMMDVKGPEIRTGDVEQPIALEKGSLLDLLCGEAVAAADGIPSVTVNYPNLDEDVLVGETVLVDSGLIRMTVKAVDDGRVRCEVIIPGELTSRRHINLPGVKVKLPALTAKDIADIAVGIEEGVDLFALSFVREADDLDLLRRHLTDNKSTARVIAKIEDQSGISNIDEIIAASDGVMVARGDLGIECPFEELPIIQRRIVSRCIQQKKPVIVATHMLESMIQSPLPTRAEVSDVANAVFEQADSIMLSGETTTGKYPVECVRTMRRIAGCMEQNAEASYNRALPLRTPKDKMLRSAVDLAQSLNNAGILVFTRRGNLAQTLSSLRPTRCPIYAFTDRSELFRRMLFLWGVEPFLLNFEEDHEVTIKRAFHALKKGQWVKPGDWLVVITNVIVSERIIDTIQMRMVE